MRGTKGGSGNTVPFRIVAERSKAPEDDSQSATAKDRDIFGDNVARSDFVDDAEHLEPETGALPFEPPPLSGAADVLTRKSAADDINDARISGGIEASNVMENRNLRPMASENPSCVRVNFAEADGAKAAGLLKAKAEAPYAREEIKHAQHQSTAAPPGSGVPVSRCQT